MKYLLIFLFMIGCKAPMDRALDTCIRGCKASGKYVESLDKKDDVYHCVCGKDIGCSE